ncbi:formate dehydrogenase accessory protein FdhE [Thermodesulfobacterium sp. TA1]|uniref:formate dehydrogenase accessory protein FdhE domain-containing protein n=1 Tax=Thermodesulfobacterium sp. TA1 TaxID=2234087 RepID=UPI001232C4E2|nr:formate dehydrogenase accessory protein FdhE [Thermodesulfobacterium sp. TA1]QER42669.1 formate dehydrogenase accessory protein FdhE [Thermodesulfobacterium sp. TA1]
MELKVWIDQLKMERPHLEGVLSLYEKVVRFNKDCEKILENSAPTESLDKLLESFGITFEVPYEFISYLKEILGNKGEEVLNNPRELWDLNLSEEKEVPEEEIKRMLFLLSLPLFRKLASERRPNLSPKVNNRCPICGEPYSLSLIDENNKRHFLCSICGYKEEGFRIGCSYCGHRECDKIDLLVDEDEIRVELCKDCKSYIKSFKETIPIYLKHPDPYLIDLISLPLEVIAQERDFIRRSPNILGIREIK